MTDKQFDNTMKALNKAQNLHENNMCIFIYENKNTPKIPLAKSHYEQKFIEKCALLCPAYKLQAIKYIDYMNGNVQQFDAQATLAQPILLKQLSILSLQFPNGQRSILYISKGKEKIELSKLVSNVGLKIPCITTITYANPCKKVSAKDLMNLFKILLQN